MSIPSNSIKAKLLVPTAPMDRLWTRYALAVLLTSLAVVLRLAVPTYLGVGFLVFYPASVAAAILGGFGPGLLATVLSAICYLLEFNSASAAFAYQDSVSWIRAAIFVAGGVGVSWLARVLRNTKEISERRQEELQLLLDASDMGGWSWDFSTDYLEGDNKTKRILGLPEDRPIASLDRVLERTRPEDRERLRLRAAELRNSAGDYEVEYRVTWPDGSLHWIMAKGRSFTLSPGVEPSYAMGIAMDITSRKAAEETLRRSENRYRGLIEVTSAAVWTAQADGRVRDSPSWRDFTGQTREQHLGFGWLQALHPEDRDQVEKEWHAAVEHNRTYETEYRLWHAQSGTYRFTSARGVPIINGDGDICEWVGMNVDITERKQAEETVRAAKESAERARAVAEDANRTKDHFLGVLSHELRTPLTPVVMGLSMLLDKRDLNPEMHQILEMVRRNVEMEARLIDDLLDVTRIAKGKIQLERKVVELSTIIERAVEVCQPDIEARMLHFGLDLGDSKPYLIDADVSRLQQVFWNLLHNAIKFTPRAGCIGIRCRRNDGQVSVEVSDSGIGIEAESLSRIFNAFEQAQGSVSRKFGGLGLGLAISKTLVEMHDGRIEVESKGRDMGATFRVCLPLTTGKTQPKATVEPAVAVDRPLRILLVEDHGATSQMISMILIEKGHLVDTAGDVSSALELAAHQSYDLLLSDLGLPDGSGYDLIRKLRARGQRFPAIALSGYGMEEDIRRSREAGFSHHLTKPASRDAIVKAVSSAAVGNGQSKTSAPQPGAPVFDIDLGIQRCFGHREMLTKMIEFFHNDSLELLHLMHTALEDGKVEEVGHAAHRLKGTVVYIGAQRASSAAQGVERAAKSGNLGETRNAVAELENQIEVLRKELASYHP